MMRLAARLLQWQSRSAASGWGSGALATTAAGAGFSRAAGTPATSTTDTAAWNGGVLEQWQGQDAQKSFVVRAAHLKRRLKGQSRYAYAREQGQRFVDAEVPKAGLAAWLEQDGNAVALAQILNFFEIQPEASVAATLRSALLQRTNDATLAPWRRVDAALCLVHYGTDEHYVEHALRCVEQVLAQLAATPVVSTDLSALHTMGHAEAREAIHAFSRYGDTLSAAAKVLQRCGRRVPRTLNDELARLVLQYVSTVPPASYPYMKKPLLRIYAWMVRAEHPASNQILLLLVEHAGAMAFHEFSSLVLATLRHHQLTPLPVELIQRLTQHALTYTGRFSCLDTANVLGSLAKMLVSLAPGVNGVSPAALDTARDTFAALLTELQGRVRRFLDPADRLHTRDAVLNSTIAFAYEWGGHVRYRSVFQAYGAFFERYVDSFEPPQLALATGILRRAQLLTPQLAEQLSARLEVVLGELRLPELSHICATFAVLPPGPQQLTWWSEAKAVAARLKADDATGVVRLNLALAFPEETSWVEGVDYGDVSTKQLVDLLPLAMGFAQFRDAIVSALAARLSAAEERLSSDDVRVVLSCGDPALVQAGQSYLRRAFAEPVWHSDTLLALPLVCDPTNPEANQQHLGTAKAVAAARVAAVAPRQFVDFADLLLTTFGDGDAAVRQFVVDGGTDLVRDGCDAVLPGIQYLALVRRYPSLTMNMEWLRSYTVHVENVPPLERDDLEDLLLSLRSLFEDVAKAPALQTLLSHLLDRSYGYSTEVDEQTARITVLFVYLQCGMTLPLVTAQHPIVARVLQSEATFSPEVRKALAMMPLPRQAPAEERRGRFVLKRLEPPHKRGARAAGSEDDGHALSLDLNAGDPFDEPYATQGEAAAAAEVEEERRKGMEGADQKELSSPPPSASAPHPEAGATNATNATTTTPSSHVNGNSATHSDVFATTAGKTQAAAAAPAEGGASPTTSAAEPHTTATNTNTAEASTDAAAAPAPEPEEKPMSYYAKFFSSSVGQILTGRGNHDAAKQQQQQQQPQRQSTASASPPSAAAATTAETTGKPEQVVPRRTRLQPSHHAAAASTSTTTSATAGTGAAPAALQPEVSPAATATAAATPAQPPAQSPTPAAVPVTTFTTAWGTPQPALATAAGGALPVMPNWAFAPIANTTASGAATHKPTSAAAAALERHHNTAFSSLFGSPPPPVAAASPTAAPPGSAVPRPSGVGGNNIFVDPSNPHTQRSRPVMSRKVVITRPGSAFANHATNNTAAAAAAAEQEEWKSVGSGVMGSSGAAPAVVLNAPPPPPPQQQPAVAAAPFPNGGDGVQGMTQFMQQTGVTKITGYSVDDENNGSAAAAAEEASGATTTSTMAAAATGGADGRPALDWMDAARRVARVTRHPRSKVKSRTHTSLSAWLSTPSARLDAAPATSAPAPAGAAAAAAGGASSGAASSSNATTAAAAAAPPPRQTTVAATVHRRRTKQEKKEAAANAAAARAAAKADKAATKAAAKAEAKAAAEAAAAAGQGGKRGGRGKAGKAAAGKNAGKTGARATTRAGRASAATSATASTAAAKKRTPARKAATTKAAAGAAGGSGGASGRKGGGGGGGAAAARAKPAAKATVKAAKKTVKAAAKKATAKKAPKAAKNKKK